MSSPLNSCRYFARISFELWRVQIRTIKEFCFCCRVVVIAIIVDNPHPTSNYLNIAARRWQNAIVFVVPLQIWRALNDRMAEEGFASRGPGAVCFLSAGQFRGLSHWFSWQFARFRQLNAKDWHTSSFLSPASWHLAAVSCSLSSDLPLMATLAPSCASPRAIPAPIPLLAPEGEHNVYIYIWVPFNPNMDNPSFPVIQDLSCMLVNLIAQFKCKKCDHSTKKTFFWKHWSLHKTQSTFDWSFNSRW